MRSCVPQHRIFRRSSDQSLYAAPNTETSIGMDMKTLINTYSGSVIEAYYDRRPLVVWERLISVGSPIFGWFFSRKWDNITASFRTAEQNQELLNIRAADLRDSIVQGKSVTFIKSGQALALRPDLVKSPEYVRELTKVYIITQHTFIRKYNLSTFICNVSATR
jgi:hypothetical protein